MMGDRWPSRSLRRNGIRKGERKHVFNAFSPVNIILYASVLLEWQQKFLECNSQ